MKWYSAPKYRNQKIEMDGIVFDSKRECKRWGELKVLESQGIISNLERQKKFVLIPSQKDDKGKCLERECSYIADFVYTDLETGKTIVEDTKGVRTKDYVIKRKLMLFTFGLRIREI